jgi:hypothetical protein
MRLVEVAAGGTLVLADVAVQFGHALQGAGLKNSGTLALYRTPVRWHSGTGIWSEGVLGMVGGNVYGNSANNSENTAVGLDVAAGQATLVDSFVWWNSGATEGDGGGILVQQGTLTIRGSTISHNGTGGPGGGIANGGVFPARPGGEVLISDSFIGFNGADSGSGISNRGVMEIVNSTVANDRTEFLTGTVIENSPGATLLLTQTTLVHMPQPDGPGGGILRNMDGITNLDQGLVLLQNTIVWGTIIEGREGGQDCVGTIVSLGNNLIGDPTGCGIVLQPTDHTGDPGLDAFVDLGTPGHSYFPLLPTSQVRGAANAAVCPQFDQIGTPREEVCDIGAIERFEGTGGVAQR